MSILLQYDNWVLFPDQVDGQFKYFSGNTKLEEESTSTHCFGYIKYPERWDIEENFNLFSIEDKGIFSKEDLLNSKDKTEIGQVNLPDKNKYFDGFNKLKEHIQNGDVYEINYCFKIRAEVKKFNPFEVFLKLNNLSKAPQSCLAKFGHNYILCASPERYLKREGEKIITQPIKGTSRRHNNVIEDEKSKLFLGESVKEKSEHVMAVDVARNDLSRVAARGSVSVDELFGVYSFKQVHQMISSISCTQKAGVGFKEIITSTFPMASMTGAPKVRAMQLIDKYEDFKRGFYSGSIGVIDQNGDFDFNVVIRSIIYDSYQNEIIIGVGSAVTILSDADEEWNECMLKAEAMLKVLS